MSSSNDGIDIRLALEILAKRSPSSSRAELTEAAAVSGTNDSTAAATATINATKRLGQEIDMNAPSSATKARIVESSPSTTEIEVQRKRLETERIERRKKIEEELHSMTVKELLGIVFEVQQQRVQAYREYDSGLDEMLSRGTIDAYPALCAEATARFSVASDTVGTIRDLLLTKHGRRDLWALIAGLQSGEREKLDATAAIHLERMRARDRELGAGTGKDPGATIGRLLNESLVSLRAKMSTIIEKINESLEELRYARMDEE